MRGNRTSKIFADGTAELYGYDQLSRLVRATYPSGRSVEYIYDAVGNRLQMLEGTAADPLAAACGGDQDCDGIVDAGDNCPTVANPDQADADRSPTPTGLVAGYGFEDLSSSLVAADVVGRNGGTYEGAGKTTGRFGSAAHFPNNTNGSEFVRVPANPTLDFGGTGLTLAAWVKPEPTTVNTSDYVVSKGGVFNLGMDYRIDGMHINAKIGTQSTASATTVLPVGQWAQPTTSWPCCPAGSTTQPRAPLTRASKYFHPWSTERSTWRVEVSGFEGATPL